MTLTFLGTGAADWKFEKHKDVEGFRRYASLLIDDCLLIDPNGDVPNALEVFGKRQSAIRYIINTHRHKDHYNEQTIALLSNAVFCDFLPGETKTLGSYTVTALKANHGTCEKAVHFIVKNGEKTIFYGLDGAWLLYDEVQAIKKNGIDLAVIDATIGNVPGDYRIFEHNNLSMVKEMKATLDCYVNRWIISHMARTLHTSHAELAEEMTKSGIEVAFDGLEIVV